MIFYDSSGNTVEVSVLAKISDILNSHYVYITEDGRCLKVFRIYDVGPELELDKKIQALQLENFYTIDEYLFDNKKVYSAFLMPFYRCSSDDILFKSGDYLGDNFSLIFNSFDRLSDECIETWDANYENLIFTDDRIIVIDSEKYRETAKVDMERVRKHNYRSVCWMLNFILINEALKHPEFKGVDFYNWFKSENPDGINLCRELSRCKNPAEYLRKIKRLLNR